MLTVADLSKRHARASRPLFSGLGFAVAAGEIVALVGESGVGKSTLLNCIAGLETADSGTIRIGPQARNIVQLDEAARAALRAGSIGFVFQAFHVLPTLTVAKTSACRCCSAACRPGNTRRAPGCCSSALVCRASAIAGRLRYRAANCSG